MGQQYCDIENSFALLTQQKQQQQAPPAAGREGYHGTFLEKESAAEEHCRRTGVCANGGGATEEAFTLPLDEKRERREYAASIAADETAAEYPDAKSARRFRVEPLSDALGTINDAEFEKYMLHDAASDAVIPDVTKRAMGSGPGGSAGVREAGLVASASASASASPSPSSTDPADFFLEHWREVLVLLLFGAVVIAIVDRLVCLGEALAIARMV